MVPGRVGRHRGGGVEFIREKAPEFTGDADGIYKRLASKGETIRTTNEGKL